MTVTEQTSLINLFVAKIDEAVSYVPRMSASEKLRAVQFWNVVSEKIQDIVNNSAADINAVLIMGGNESEKIALEVINSNSVNIVPQSNMSSDFVTLTSNYELCGTSGQYQTLGIRSAQFLSPESFSIVAETTLNNTSTNIQHTKQLNNIFVKSCQNTVSSHIVATDSLSQHNCDTIVVNSSHIASPSNSPYLCIKNTQCDSKILTKETSQKQESPKNCKLKSKQTPDKINPAVIHAKATETDVDSDLNQSESIVSFVVSNTEKILSKNEIEIQEILDNSSEKDCDKKLLDDSESTISHKRYSCPTCPAKFSTKGNLNVHMRRHTGDRPYSCDKCPATFTTRGNLKRHIRTHTGEKPWECSDCGSKFAEKKCLVVHMRRHTGEKPYECKLCMKSFSQNSGLQMHMDVHNDQRSHLCEFCGKSFRQKSQLAVHRLRHDNVKKYECTSCPARFITKGDFERHMRSHTGVKPFICEICSKSFTRQQSLTEHKNRHKGIKPYICKYCARQFHDMSACYKHEKLIHKKGKQKLSRSNEVDTDSKPSPIKNNNSLPNDINTYEIIKLSTNESSKSETGAISKDPEASAEAQQTLTEYIENFFLDK